MKTAPKEEMKTAPKEEMKTEEINSKSGLDKPSDCGLESEGTSPSPAPIEPDEHEAAKKIQVKEGERESRSSPVSFLPEVPAPFATMPLPTLPRETNTSSLPGAYAASCGPSNPLRLVPARASALIHPDDDSPDLETAGSTATRTPGSSDNNGNRSSSSGQDLIEASPVQDQHDSSLPHAVPQLDKEAKEDHWYQQTTKVRMMFLVTLLIVVFTAVGVLAAWLAGAIGEDQIIPPTSNVSDSNPNGTSVVVMSPDQVYLQQYLPGDTLDAVWNDPGSPQARAFQWLYQDPSLENYSIDRLRQRFALGCFFYSTGGGTTWNKTTHWLSYNVHECEWYFEGKFYIFGRLHTANTPCQTLESSAPGSDSTVVQEETNTTTVATYDDEDESSYYKLLWIPYNNCSGHLPNELYWLTNLESIDLSSGGTRKNHIGGTIATEVAKLTNLQQLSYYKNVFTGTIPALGLLNQTLEILYINENHLTGTIPVGIFYCHLDQLTLSQNQLSGTVPTELGLLSDLTILGLSETSITGTIPTEIGRLSHLSFSYTELNQWTGTLPSEVGLLTNLKWFQFWGNQLSGEIPSEIGLLSDNAHELRFDDNSFSSTIPTELGLLTNVYELDLSGNDLSGTLISELVELPRLRILLMGDNQLWGTIPPSFAQLTELQRLGLEGNSLVGEIPSELGSLMEHEVLYEMALHDNALTGTVPNELCELGTNVSFDCDGIDLCGCDCDCEI